MGGTLADVWGVRGDTWTELTSTNSVPGPRRGAPLVYDPARGTAVLFGGLDETGKHADIWEWSGSSWADRTATSGAGPIARSEHTMTYGGGKVWLFGGSTAGGIVDELWTWDGTWTNVPKSGDWPGGRRAGTLLYDSDRDALVLVGGVASTGLYATDFWEYAEGAWSQYALVGPPTDLGRRQGQAAAYNPRSSASGVAVVFGGERSGSYLNDTWEWNGTTWAVFNPGDPPAGRYYPGMVFDDDRARVLMFGGSAGGTSYVADLWEWNGTSWSALVPQGMAPTGRTAESMAYDSWRQRTVLHGGFDMSYRDELWELDASTHMQPAVQLTAAGLPDNLAATAISGLRVRAACDGSAPSEDGAALWGWKSYGLTTTAGEWVELPTTGTSLLEWQAASAAEAQSFLVARDRQLTFQCRTRGTAGVGQALLTADYLEIRVQYVAQ